jgi:hypothetical protein
MACGSRSSSWGPSTVGELMGLGSARGMARQMLRQSAKRASGFVLWKRILRRWVIIFRICWKKMLACWKSVKKFWRLVFFAFFNELWMIAVKVLLYTSYEAEEGSMMTLNLDTKGRDWKMAFNPISSPSPLWSSRRIALTHSKGLDFFLWSFSVVWSFGAQVVEKDRAYLWLSPFPSNIK